MRKVLIVDAERCNNCRSCEVACSTAKEGEVCPQKSRVRLTPFSENYFYYPTVCLQCEIPYCAHACPTGALGKDLESGVVGIEKAKCIGCKMCLVACPFGAMGFIDGVAAKCDLCGGDPACVKFCEPQALTFGEPDDISAGKRLNVAQRMKDAHEGTTGGRAGGVGWLKTAVAQVRHD